MRAITIYFLHYFCDKCSSTEKQRLANFVYDAYDAASIIKLVVSNMQ